MSEQIKKVNEFFGEKKQLPYQAKLHEHGIESFKDDWLMYVFELLDAPGLDPIEQVSQVKPAIKEWQKVLRKTMRFAAAGEHDDFYTRVIAWTRIITVVMNILEGQAEPENKVFLCRDLLARGDMMLQVSTMDRHVSPTKTFAFQGQAQGGRGVDVTTQQDGDVPTE